MDRRERQPDERRVGQREQAEPGQRGPPAEPQAQPAGDDGPGGEAEVARERVGAEALPAVRGVADDLEQREVRGVERRLADPRQQHEAQQREVGVRERRRGGPQAGDRDAHHEDPLRAGAVDEVADRDLQYRGHQEEQREQQPQLGVADAELLAEQREQRREDEEVEVREEVRDAHGADDEPA